MQLRGPLTIRIEFVEPTPRQLENVNGWPAPIFEIYKKGVLVIDDLGMDGKMEMGYGPAHVVWGDENWHCARSCLADFERYIDQQKMAEENGPAMYAIVRQSLEELVALNWQE